MSRKITLLPMISIAFQQGWRFNFNDINLCKIENVFEFDKYIRLTHLDQKSIKMKCKNRF